jgi:hypothetical protein
LLRRDHLQTEAKNIGYACEKDAKRNFEPWRDQSKIEEVNETTESLHQLKVEEVREEEIELREWNATVQLEEKVLNKKRMQSVDMLDESGYETPGWKKTGVVEWRRKAPTVVREAVVEQRSKVGREDDQSFHGSRASRVDSLPIQLFLGSSLHVKAKGREDASGFQLGEEDGAYAILRAQSRIRFIKSYVCMLEPDRASPRVF